MAFVSQSENPLFEFAHPNNSLIDMGDFDLDKHIEELHKKPDEMVALQAKVNNLTTELNQSRQAISAMESRLEALECSMRKSENCIDYIRTTDAKVQKLEYVLGPLFSENSPLLQSLSSWGVKMDAYCASMMKGMALQVVNANKYIRSFIKDVMFDLRRGRNAALDLIDQPSITDPKANPQDRRGMTDPYFNNNDRAAIKRASPGHVAEKIQEIVDKRFCGLDRLAEFASNCQHATETGEYKAIPFISDPGFDSIADLLGSEEKDFNDVLERMEKSTTAYTLLTQFKPKTDLRFKNGKNQYKKRMAELTGGEEEEQKSKKSKKQTDSEETDDEKESPLSLSCIPPFVSADQ